MPTILYSRFRRNGNPKYPRIRPMVVEWSTHVGIWIVGLMVAYALAGMTA